MSHGNARTTVHGRLLIVRRHQAGIPKADIAAAMGISRNSVSHWFDRYVSEGEAGLHDRFCRPRITPTRTSSELEQQVLELHRAQRRGQDWIGSELGLAPRTEGRILRRHQVPYLRELDRLSRALIRASKTTAVRYERDRPGELVHVNAGLPPARSISLWGEKIFTHNVPLCDLHPITLILVFVSPCVNNHGPQSCLSRRGEPPQCPVSNCGPAHIEAS